MGSKKQFSRRQFLALGAQAGAAAAVLAACSPLAPAVAPEATKPVAGSAPQQDAGTPAPASASSAGAKEAHLFWLVKPMDEYKPWYNYVLKTVPEQIPGTTVELIESPSTEYETKLSALLAANTAPDLWSQWGNNNFVDYAYNGLVMPIDDLIASEKVDLSDFFPRWLEENKIKGKLVGLPAYAGGAYVFYNADMFDKGGVPHPPAKWNTAEWTLDAFLSAAKKLTKNYGDMENAQYGLWASNGLPFEDAIWLFGGEPWPKEAYRGIATQSLVDSPACIEALQWWADVACVHKAAPNPEVNSALNQAGIGGLAGARAAMEVTGVWGFSSAVLVKGFKWGVGAVPKGKALKNGIYADPILIYHKSPSPVQAFKTMLTITSEPALRLMVEGSLWPSPRHSHVDFWAGKMNEKGCINTPAEIADCLRGSWEYGQYAPMNDIAGYSAKTWDVLIAGLDPLWKCERKASEVLPELKKSMDEALKELKFAGIPW